MVYIYMKNACAYHCLMMNENSLSINENSYTNNDSFIPVSLHKQPSYYNSVSIV